MDTASLVRPYVRLALPRASYAVTASDGGGAITSSAHEGLTALLHRASWRARPGLPRSLADVLVATVTLFLPRASVTYPVPDIASPSHCVFDRDGNVYLQSQQCHSDRRSCCGSPELACTLF
jgi:hypothetical protein